jgi:DNA-binding response OmpR family regulator
MVRRLLEREGYRVFEADTVGGLATVLHQVPIALVIADGDLDDGGFAEVCERCAALRPLARVLQYSSGLAVDDPSDALRKPFEPNELVVRVGGLLSSSPSLGA